jgi:hypothetical protein
VDILKEKFPQIKSPAFQQLLDDVARLDLQLENSLWLSHLEESPLYFEKIPLQQMIQALREDFSELDISLDQDISIEVDRRAFLSVLRNLFQNSILHGEATRVDINVRTEAARLSLILTDDGAGYKGDSSRLGAEILREKQSKGNGIGLMLSRKLMSRMHGDLRFLKSEKGFQVEICVLGSASASVSGAAQ